LWTVGYSVGSALLPIQWEDDEEEEEESSQPPLHQKERSTSVAFYVQVLIPTGVVDPDSLFPDPDPAFQVNQDPDRGFDDQVLMKKYRYYFFFFFFIKKNYKSYPIILKYRLEKKNFP
jgi:hypothetical protein